LAHVCTAVWLLLLLRLLSATVLACCQTPVEQEDSMLTALQRLGQTWQPGQLETNADLLTDKGQLCPSDVLKLHSMGESVGKLLMSAGSLC
jgi:hypothetical protein